MANDERESEVETCKDSVRHLAELESTFSECLAPPQVCQAEVSGLLLVLVVASPRFQSSAERMLSQNFGPPLTEALRGSKNFVYDVSPEKTCAASSL